MTFPTDAVTVTLAPDVVVTAEGFLREDVTTAIGDPLLAAALAAGIPLGTVAERSEMPVLLRRQLLVLRIADMVVAMPAGSGVRWTHNPLADALDDRPHARLSRYAVLRREGQRWVLESGRSRWRIVLQASVLATLGDLQQPEAQPLRTLLAITDMLDRDDAATEANYWTPHERLFAAFSRADRSEHPGMSAYRSPPPPARRSDPPVGERIPLPVPTAASGNGPPLWEVIEQRRSVREFAPEPMSLSALGSLLWHTLRVVRCNLRDAGDPDSYETVFRPVGSGGAMHATDLWLVCDRVTGIAPGVWWYDPFAHALVRVENAAPQSAERFLATLRSEGYAPAVLGLLTARHARTARKYAGIAYALELKDAGVIMHALQLAAVALDVGMCPLGSGPTSDVCNLLALDPERDTPVGEFLLGMPAQG